MEFHVSKGMALAVRAIFNVDPEKMEKDLNEAFSRIREIIDFTDRTMKHFDERLIAIETQLEKLSSKLQPMERKDDDGNDSAAA